MPILHQHEISLYYETFGASGPWLTLVNGHTRSSRDFRLLAKTFVEKSYRVLTLDNRGSGQTTESGPFTLNEMMQDVVRLWDELKITQSHLVGISMGGMISQRLAATYPLRVAKLVLVSTAAHAGHLASLSFESWGQDPESVLSRLKRYVSDGYYERNKLLMQAMAKQILAAIQHDNFEARAAAQHEAIAELDNRPLLGRIQAPTLIIHGTDDRVIPSTAAEELANAIPNAELQLLAGRGHLLLAEDSKGLGQTIVEFIDKN